jgi:Protein of unknown function (DUF3108)
VRKAAVLALLLSLSIVGCGGDGGPPPTSVSFLSSTPWELPETSIYRIEQGDIEGTGSITIDERGSNLLVEQSFEGGGFASRAEALVDATELTPATIDLVVEGDEGSVTCHAEYSGGSVTAKWELPNDETTLELDVDSGSYDSWTDLLLWRTLPFAENTEAGYSVVASCRRPRQRPESADVRLTVEGTETVSVPAGSFEAWVVNVRVQGETQVAWYSTEPEHPLVRYDNGDQVFELESIN